MARDLTSTSTRDLGSLTDAFLSRSPSLGCGGVMDGVLQVCGSSVGIKLSEAVTFMCRRADDIAPCFLRAGFELE